jgi:membrane associated rhomboid family serine protease
MIAWRRDSEGDGERPWATWALLAGMLAAQLGAGGSADVHARLGVVPADPRLPALAAHLFLHTGWLPLLASLGFVAAAGPWLEARLGRALFVAAFFAAGLAGAAVHVAQEPDATAPWLGAACAVAGLLALLAVAGRGARVDWLAVAAGRAGSLHAPAFGLAALWLGGEIAGLVTGEAGAVVAHVASFGFGLALALALEKSGAIEREAPALDEAPRKSHARGPKRLPITLPQHPEQLEALLSEAVDPALAQAYLANAQSAGRLESARAVVAERLAEALEWKRREPAIALGCALFASGQTPRAGVDELLQLASWLRGAGHAGEATCALHAALANADAPAAAKIARAARRSDPLICYRAVERALADPACAGSERKALEGLASEAEREVVARGIIVVPSGCEAPAKADASAGASLASARGARTAAPVGASEASARSSANQAPSRRSPPRGEPAAAPRRALALGEAIELAPEPAPPPPALPDPEHAGDSAFLDALGAALLEDEPKPDAPRLRPVRVREATMPRALEGDVLVLEVPGKGPLRLRLARVHAVALAAVRGISERAGDKPVLLVDLCLSPEAEPELHVLRLRSDRFDPRRLVPGDVTSPLVALRSFVGALAAAARAPLLPAPEVAGDAPLHIYRDLAAYQREVLGAA